MGLNFEFTRREISPIIIIIIIILLYTDGVEKKKDDHEDMHLEEYPAFAEKDDDLY